MIKFVTRSLAVLATVGIVAATTPASASGPMKPGRDIVETAVAAGSFETLVAAVQAAGLVETLQSDGPFTVFAPTDEAFAALPEGTVESLLQPENKDKLVAILTYHVVAGEVPSSAVNNKITMAETVEGSELSINGVSGGVMVNDANVVRADIITDNGYIHVIDKVLIPGM